MPASKVEVSYGSPLRAEAPYELVRKMRASVVVLGPLLARLNHVKVSLPGGCAIGGRPIDIHLDGFKALGAEIHLDQGYVDVRAKELHGGTFRMPFASVGATENPDDGGHLDSGENCFTKCRAGTGDYGSGGHAQRHGRAHPAALEQKRSRLKALTKTAWRKTPGDCRSHRSRKLHDRGGHDARVAQRGELPSGSFDLAYSKKCVIAGVAVERLIRPNHVSVTAPEHLLPVSAETAVYPGFPTDLQAQWMVCMALSNGSAQITEQVFENRFMHVAELQRMGANIQAKGNTASVDGVAGLSGADVMVSDLRAGAALVLAGLAAQGKTTIHRIYHLDRGYEDLEKKLSQVGATITRGQE